MADLEALRSAGEQLDALIAEAGTGEEELAADFKERAPPAPKDQGLNALVLDGNILIRAALTDIRAVLTGESSRP